MNHYIKYYTDIYLKSIKYRKFCHDVIRFIESQQWQLVTTAIENYCLKNYNRQIMMNSVLKIK